MNIMGYVDIFVILMVSFETSENEKPCKIFHQ